MSKFETKSKRYFSAHLTLMNTVSNLLYKTKEEAQHVPNLELISLVLTGLTLEAFCNSVLEQTIKDWKEFESCSPKAKIRIICEHLKIPYDKSREPIQGLHWCIDFRNSIAHAKPQNIEAVTIGKYEDYEQLREGNGPLSKLESKINHKNAMRAHNSLDSFKKLILEKVENDLEVYLNLTTDGFHISATMNGS